MNHEHVPVGEGNVGSGAAPPTSLRGLAAVGCVFRTNARGSLRGRRGIVLLLLVFLPTILILISDILGTERGGGSYFFMENIVPVFHYIELVIYIFLGCSVLGDAIEDRTLTYDLICPVSRGSLFAGRYLTYIVSSLLLLVPAVVAVHLVCMARYGLDDVRFNLPLLWAVLAATVLGALVYGAAFLFLSLLTKRAVLVAIILAICVEGFVANLPLRVSTCSMLYHLRNVMVAVSGKVEFFPAHGMAIYQEMDPVALTHSVVVLAVTWLAFLVASLLLFQRKQFP